MKSNYKRIGDYIKLVDERNSDLKTETLLGLTINKDFIPSVANTVGSDMSRYKIIRNNQFACSLMQVRRDKKMPVALQRNYEKAIISQAYPVFEIINEDEILPEYLMMWFSRLEFDREACFYAVGGVRGSLEWEDFCNMELPVPNIEKQKAIVKEYHTIVNRIKLNERLNKILEETAQAIYKEWFVDFEFPDESGKGYKSNGGRMVYNEELERDIPVGWEITELGNLIEYKKGFAFKSDDYRDKGVRIVRVSNFTQNSIDINNCFFIDYDKSKDYSEFMLKENDIIISTVGSWPNNPNSIVGKVIKVPMLADNSLLNQNSVRLRAKEIISHLFIYYSITKDDFSEHIISGAQGSANQASITLEHIFCFKIVFPEQQYRKFLFPLFDKVNQYIEVKNKEIYYLSVLYANILQKMAKVC